MKPICQRALANPRKANEAMRERFKGFLPPVLEDGTIDPDAEPREVAVFLASNSIFGKDR